MNFTPADEKTFQRIMAEPVERQVLTPDELRNRERIEAYRKRCAEHRMLTYRHNGEIKYAVGFNERMARQRALIDCGGDDIEEISMGPVEAKA